MMSWGEIFLRGECGRAKTQPHQKGTLNFYVTYCILDCYN